MDERRHSVDIPLSKTLVALRRVRSLRDPSTNSMSKLSAFVDNWNWETNSTNGITLGFVNGFKDGGIDENDAMRSKDLGYYEQKGEHVDDSEMNYNLSKRRSSMLVSGDNSGWAGFVPAKTVQAEEDNLSRPDQDIGCENKSICGRYCSDYWAKGLDLNCTTPSDHLEGAGSCNEPVEESLQAERLDHTASKRKSRYKKQIRSSRVAAGDVMSRTSSPCLSISDAPLEGSSCGTSFYGNTDVDVVNLNQSGCGISCCWSKTPRFRESYLASDVEDQRLLSGEVGMMHMSEQRSIWKHMDNEVTPYLDSPLSLSHKYRPKSFSELVGQNVVARSLLNAILNGRITPFYFFHGPRGTGKTSASRIFAAALNCLSHKENRPCGLCQYCIAFFSGRSKDVKEVDSVGINRAERVRHLVKNAMAHSVSSRFKVFIVDECHLLRGETWTTLLKNIEELPRHVVFIMITPDLDKVPRSAVSRSQRYHFPKIKEADTSNRLRKICTEERIDHDQVALDFIATKSNGSLRDAEMMLEQLSLLGKRITLPLVYELIGVVSDEELLDLLDLALSSDTSNTVRRARELMRTRIDPMQLISQLANLIMDTLAGQCPDGASGIKRKFYERHASEGDMRQLSHALRILSETEKQLRTSKNQTTWLTVALLQLSSVGSSTSDANDSRFCLREATPRGGDFLSTSSTAESLKHLVSCACGDSDPCKLGIENDEGTLESIWRGAIELCGSNSLKNFLRKKGSLASVCFSQGLAVVDLEFYHSDYVSKAEKSQESIANALQSMLGCNVEIRINLVRGSSMTKYAKLKKPSFSLFSCSRWMRHDSPTERGSNPSENHVASEKPLIREKSSETRSSGCGSPRSHICCHTKEAARTTRNSDANAANVGMAAPHRLIPGSTPKQHGLNVDSSRERCGCRAISAQEPEEQPSCFSRPMKIHKLQSETSMITRSAQNNLELSIPGRRSSEKLLSCGEGYTFCCSCNYYHSCAGGEDR
ncbi:hypothetical protein RJ640_030290 [Escallonia rubra]|uniref:DNA-directed DNA polymerase n=1 Tax=Escallonia rubra TaxID=112253 RepID=A0AA88QUC6_9ASTE|nr:hypothetical protein RJ640_030290 [Escallonia rubra]